MTFEAHHKTKDGRVFPVEISANYLKYNKEEYICAYVRDITERKRVEVELHNSENRYREVVETTDDFIVRVDSEGRFLFVNHMAEKILGISPEQCIGLSAFNFIHPDDRENDKKVLKEWLVEGLKSTTYENRWVNRNGQIFNMLWTVNFQYDANGNLIGINSIARDITERKKVEEVLQKQKKDLEQKNIALHEVLGQIELEKKQIKDNVIANAENLLLPVIQKLRLKGESRKYVHLLRKNLQELTSSFGAKLTKMEARLTSREIEICNMIKNGLTSKEIASLLNITLRTTEKHRANIRNKLGIINKDLNLTSFLKTL